MHYDPIKKVLGDFVGTSPFLRRLFYTALGILFLREWYIRRLLKSILASSGGPVNVLDAGSGFGQYSYFIARKFPRARITAVDVKEDQINDCRRFFQQVGLDTVKFDVLDLTTMEYENAFDIILSVDVMEHIEDDERVFRNFFRALKQGGRLIVNTPASGSKESGEPLAKDDSFIGEHVRYGYTPDEIRQKLERAGFNVESITFTYGRFGSIAWNVGIKIPMVIAGLHRSFLLLLPFYFLITLPFTLAFMYLDYTATNTSGGGLLVLARKSS